MCGIVGLLVASNAEPPNRQRIERAVNALRHRGPDGRGVHVEGPIGLGHTRLSIIDPDGGAQPIANEDGAVLAVYNGEIWNHERLRFELERRGHRFRTRCDSEVLVHGYEEWGDRLPEHLDGMFAFAVWDRNAQRILLARDRVGKKPLYVARTSAGLAFGSDARSVLLAAGLQPELDRDAVPEFLFQRYVGAPRTLFKGIERLQPGHRLSYDRKTYDEDPYWTLQPGPEHSLDPRALRGALVESVRERLMSDVPLGILLSGGVDSTAVLGLMREAGAESIASFTIGFDNPAVDERSLARLAADRYATDHHELVVDARRFHEPLGRLAWFRDEPIAESSEIPLFLLAEAAAQQVKVVLSGDGGDELYGGYPKYMAERLLRSPLPGKVALLRLVAAALGRSSSPRRIDRAIETIAVDDTELRWASWFRSFSPSELAALLAGDLGSKAADTVGRNLRAVLEPYAGLDPGRKMLIADFLTYLPDNMLLRADKVLMGASVEGRMPLLDRRVVERVSDVSARDRIKRRTPKALLRNATADLVPEPIRSGVKRGFPVPIASFLLDGDDSPMRAMLRSERFADRGLFDPRAIDALVSGSAKQSSRELKLFTIASLELWLRTNVDEVRDSPPESLEELLEPEETAALRAA